MNTVWGFPAGAFSRFFVSYSYQRVRVKDLNPFYSQAANLVNNPFLADTLLLNQGGERRISKIGPSFLFNTVDNPIFPTTGRKLSLSTELAGLGGNAKFYTAKTEGILYKAVNRRMSLGMRAAFEFIAPYGEVPPASTGSRCRSSRSCFSVASTAFAASTSAASARATSRTSSSLAATRAFSLTPST